MSSTSLFKSERNFVVFSYTMSHGLLLLRSRKSPENPKRLDVLFQDVRALEIRTWFDSLTIEEAGLDLLRETRSKADKMMEHGTKVYSLKSSGWRGFIVGGLLTFCEDDGEAFEPSKLISGG